MAVKDIYAEWVDVYEAANGGRLIHHDNPLWTGWGAGKNYQNIIKIPESVKTAIRTSSTPAKLRMWVYFTTGAAEIDVGHHRERNRRSVGSRGVPWYSRNETWRKSSGAGWREYEMSNWFLPNLLSGNVTGIVLYSYRGTYNNVIQGLGTITPIQFRVEGTWNTPPSMPSNLRFNRSVVDNDHRLDWNAATDSEQSASQLRYDVEFYNGSSWSRVATKQSGLYYTRDTTKDAETKSARYCVRTWDGEEYSGWRYSSYFEIKHVPPVFNNNQISFKDINPVTVAITGTNQKLIQTASTLEAKVNTAAQPNENKTISRYIFTVCGMEKTTTTTGALNFGEISCGGNQRLRVTAVDSKGLTTTASVNIDVLYYETPKLVYSGKRQGSLGDLTDITLSGTIKEIKVNNVQKNSLQTTRYRYRRKDGSFGSWFTFARTISGNGFTANPVTLNLDNTVSWIIEIEVSDRIKSTLATIKIGSGKPIFFVDEMLESVSVNMYPTRRNTFQLNAPLEMFNGLIPKRIGSGTDINTVTEAGFYYNDLNGQVQTMPNRASGSAFSLLVEHHAGIKQTWTNYHKENVVIYVRNSYLGEWGEWVCITGEFGTNSNGTYTKLPDGTLICSTTATLTPVNTAWGSLYYAYMTPQNWTFPHEFVSMPSVEASFQRGSFWLITTRVSKTSANGLSAARPTTTSGTIDVKLTATGRWK